MIQIKLLKEQNLKNYTIMEAFPGIGLVGPMAGSYMIEKLKMEYIGHIESDQFPPITTIHHSIPMFPARIYKNEKLKLLLFMSEFTISPLLVYQLALEILAFARKYGAEKIVSVGGMPAQKPVDTIYIASSNSAILKKAQKMGLKAIEEGVVSGVSAALLVGAAEYKIPAFDILVEVNPSITDPKYAEIAIEGLNKVLDIDIDLSELDKEAKIVEAKIREMLSKVKNTHDQYASSSESTGPSMYA